MMINLDTIQKDIASLPLKEQQTIFELVKSLKKHYLINEEEILENASGDWSDFIGCMEAESDLSQNYKTYLNVALNQNVIYWFKVAGFQHRL